MKLSKPLLRKFILPIFLTFLILTGSIYLLTKTSTHNNSLLTILLGKPTEITLAGTGSMYPTLYWDNTQGGPEDYTTALIQNRERVLPHLYFHLHFPPNKPLIENPKVGFGDIVSFKGPDPKTNQTIEYIKRVIGLPQDKIELRDGFVIRNGVKLHEAYTLKPRSTFGGTAIPECTEITIPQNKYMVLGDNRKLSFDSRYDIGFIENQNIDFILSFGKQQKLQSKWRKIETDEFTANKTTLNTQSFLSKINTLRKNLNLKALTLNTSLNNSAAKRANFILDNNNFNTRDAKGNNYFSKDIQNAGYSNILTAEYIIQGYYDSEELFDLRLESSELNTLITEKDYQDIGIGVVNKNVNDCPTQVIVLHFGGYVPAAYDQNTLNTWKNAVEYLTKTSRTWKEARGNELYNQTKLETLLTDYEKALTIAKAILYKVEQSLWLTDLDNAKIKEYERLVEEINKLSEELNNEAKKESQEVKQKNYETCIDNWELYVSKKEECKKYL